MINKVKNQNTKIEGIYVNYTIRNFFRPRAFTLIKTRNAIYINYRVMHTKCYILYTIHMTHEMTITTFMTWVTI